MSDYQMKSQWLTKITEHWQTRIDTKQLMYIVDLIITFTSTENVLGAKINLGGGGLR